MFHLFVVFSLVSPIILCFGLGPSELYLSRFENYHSEEFDEDLTLESLDFTTTELTDKAGLLDRTQCQRDVNRIFLYRALKAPWAMKYLDSWAKKPAGLFQGYFRWYGDFDQCLSLPAVYIDDDQDGVDERSFNSQFCVIGLARFRNESEPSDVLLYYPGINFGICVPDSCKPEELPEVVDSYLKRIRSKLHSVKGLERCVDPSPPLGTAAYVAITIFSLIGLYLLAGLFVDVLWRLRNSSPKRLNSISGHFSKLLLAFSPLTNFGKIFKPPSPTQTTPNLSCLNGIRVLSLGWVILGHIFIIMLPAYDNQFWIYGLPARFTFQIILTGIFAVDTFFFLSGFLAYWSLAKVINKMKKPLNLLKSAPWFYLLRYLRLTPPYAALILIEAGLWAYIGTGPFYLAETTDRYCSINWWTNLLYVNNFVDVNRGCAAWGWYLAIDMQLFLLMPFVVYLFKKKPLWGWLVLLTGLLVSIATSWYITVYHNMPSLQFPPTDYYKNLNGTEGKDFNIFYEVYYIKPYTRMAPYIIGIGACHLIMNHAKFLTQKVFSNKFLNVIGWLLCFSLFGVLVYGLYPQYHGDYINPDELDVVYNSLSKIAWGLAVAWLVCSCVLNKAGLIGSFLSWSFWSIPARLSYAAYLLHPTIMFYYYETARTPYHASDLSISFLYPGIVSIVLLCATVFSLAFESPVVGLLSMLKE